MKQYPSIPREYIKGHPYYIFEKLDGSNIRAEWSKKQGFHKFGTRTQMLGEGNSLYPAIEKFMNKYSDDLAKKFVNDRHMRAIVFFEYVGPNSFAGAHPDSIEDIDVVLFDVNPYKKGILNPRDFLKQYGDLHTAQHLFVSNINSELVDLVRNGELEGQSFEGIVGKTIHKNQIKMTKLKSQAWLDRLKSECETEEEFLQRA